MAKQIHAARSLTFPARHFMAATTMFYAKTPGNWLLTMQKTMTQQTLWMKTTNLSAANLS